MDDKIKQAWTETRFRRPSEDSIENILNGKREAALQRLAKRYKRFSIQAAAAILLGVTLLPIDVIPEKHRIILSLIYALVMLTASVMDHWLSKGISKIDCATMNVQEVATKALFYRKRHFQFMAILFPMAIAYVGYLIWSISGNSLIIVSTIIGALCGLCIGLRFFKDFMDDYRDVVS